MRLTPYLKQNRGKDIVWFYRGKALLGTIALGGQGGVRFPLIAFIKANRFSANTAVATWDFTANTTKKGLNQLGDTIVNGYNAIADFFGVPR